MSLVYNTNISKTEYLVDLEDNGKAKQTALLSMSSTAPSGEFKKGSQYYNSSDKKIYTAVEDNVWGTTGKDPNFGVIYQCDNEYYVWDGDNLITTDLEGYEKLVNKATNFNTVNNTKYPTTKAVADYVVKESIVRNFTDAGITKTTSSDVFSDRTNNTGLAEEILAKQFPTGTTLYGEVRNQGMPTGIGNAEIRVEILETKSNGAQVIEFTLFSVDIEPKEWSHIYFSARTEQQNPWVWVPKAVPTDDYTSNATTTVPTSKALNDGLLLKQDISNKSDDFTEDSSIKYPSSKALSDGLKSVEPNLYDIKTLSQAIVNKGWAYQCKSVRTDLAKADVPTVYNDIEYKYLNCDKVPSSSLIQLTGTSPYRTVDIDDTYVYSGDSTDWKLKRTRLDNLPSVNWETVVNSQLVANPSYRALCVGEKILIASFQGANNSIDIKVYKKSDWTLLKTYTHTYNNGMQSYCSSIYIGSVRKFVIGYKDTDSSTNSSYMVFVEDNDTLQETAYTLPYQQNCIPVYINGYYIFMHRNKEQITKYITRTTDFINFENVYSYDGWSYDEVQPIGKAGNKLMCFLLRYVSSDNGETWVADNSLPSGCVASSICQKENSFYVISGNKILFSDNLPSFTIVYTGASNLGNFITVNDSADMFFIKKDYPLYFLGYNSVVYTDNYTINGSTVNIQYYKYNDWKICIAGENGTDDINLDTVFDDLGYLNYWRLDRNGQTVTLPRNSNLYTQMFVGDNYDDTEDNLISGSYIAYQTKTLKFTNLTASNWVADNTYADYGYKCDLSCSGVTANMFAQVIFAPTEADSGNYATVCNTGNGTVTIYSKVNDTITIPSIVVMGV